MNYASFSKAFHEFLGQDPNYAVSAGLQNSEYRNLPKASSEHEAELVKKAKALREQVEKIDSKDFDESLDLELAALKLDFITHSHTLQMGDRTQRERMPRAADEIGDGIFLMFINDPRHSYERLSDIQARIEKVPAYLKDRLANTKEPVKRWASMDIAKVEALPSLFENILAWSDSERYVGHSSLRQAMENAAEAIKDYSAALKKLPTSDSIHLDQDSAKKIIKFKGIDLSLEQIHQVAVNFIKQNREDLSRLREKLVSKHKLDPSISSEELQAHLNTQYKVSLSSKGSFHEVLDRYQAEREKILQFIDEKKLFPIPKDQEMKIMKTPLFMEPSIPAGAMMSPPPFRNGTRISNVYLTLREDILDEHTEISIPIMMVHEGIPGHHLQLTWAGLNPSIIRRHIEAMDQAEGWTTMLEDYMLDIGYGGDLEEEIRFVTKRDIARIGARVAIDLYFMTGNKDLLDLGLDLKLDSQDPFENAGRVLHAVTGFTPGRLQAELNWYSQERGYPLSYLTGNHLVWTLKRDFQAKNSRLSTTEQDRLFHDTFLKAGSMPMKFLRTVYERKGLI